MSRVYNFSAGPAAVPLEVLQKAQSEMLDWHGSGMSVMEMSHRGKDYISIAEKAEAGMIGINVGVPVPREPFGFGGWNDSKFGQGDVTGESSIAFWTKPKKVTTKWNASSWVNWMS